MKQTALIILLVLACVGLGALYVVERIKPNTDIGVIEREDSPVLSREDSGRISRLEAKLADRELELAELRRKLTETKRGEVVNGAPVVVNVPGAGGDDDGGVTTNLGDGLAKMIQQALLSAMGGSNTTDGGLLGGLTRSSGSGVSQRQRRLSVYEDLIASLGLDERQAAAFRELLGKQRGGMTVEVLGTGDGLTTDLGSILGGISGSQDEAIRELLGEEGFAEYERFAETESARMMVSEFEGLLSGQKLAIGADQRADLVKLFQSVRMTDQEGAADLNDGLSFSLDGEQPLDEKVEGSLDSLVARYEKLAEDADAVLSAGQSEQLRAYLDRKLEQKEMEGDLARRLLSNVSIQGVPSASIQGSVKVMGPGMSVGVISSSSEITVPAERDGKIQVNLDGGETSGKATP